jgi:hypothetical protein
VLPHNAHSRVPMAMSRTSPGSRSDELLDKLLAAIGKGDSDSFERYALVQELHEIEAVISKRRGQPTPASYTTVLEQFRANTAKRLELRKRFRPVYDDIVMAGYLRSNPGADEDALRAALQDRQDSTERIDPAKFEAGEDQDIAAFIDSGDDYRKRQVRKQVVEPFLRFLEKHDVVPSRKLPRTRMMRALFDWLEIEQKLRPTEAGIRTIARDFKRSP